MRVVIWMNIPSHHQASFFEALRQAGVDLLVRYYDHETLQARLAQGWRQEELCEGEAIVQPTLRALETIPDYKERIHIVPGYGAPFLRKLAAHLSEKSVEWAHWSECSRPGVRWLVGYVRKRRYGRLVARHALGAFAQGLLAKDDFVRWGVPLERIAFLHYAPRAGNRMSLPDAQCSEASNGRNSILFVGVLRKLKGVDVLLKAFASIPHEKRRSWALLLVGKDVSEGRYRKMARGLGLSGSVGFTGPVSSDRIPAVMRCAKVLVLPSLYDGWGVVLNEAASMGVALIGSDRAGAAHHLVCPGVNGFRVRAGNVDSLRSALLAYIHNPRLADKHGEASLKIAEEFIPERNAQRFLAAIESWRSMRGVPKVQ